MPYLQLTANLSTSNAPYTAAATTAATAASSASSHITFSIDDQIPSLPKPVATTATHLISPSAASISETLVSKSPSSSHPASPSSTPSSPSGSVKCQIPNSATTSQHHYHNPHPSTSCVLPLISQAEPSAFNSANNHLHKLLSRHHIHSPLRISSTSPSPLSHSSGNSSAGSSSTVHSAADGNTAMFNPVGAGQGGLTSTGSGGPAPQRPSVIISSSVKSVSDSGHSSASLSSSFGGSPLNTPSLNSPSTPSSPNPLPRHSVKETHHINIDYDPISGRKTLNTYEIIRELGRGQHGKVKLARNLETSEYVAIKIVDRTGRPRLGRQRPGSTQEDKIRREVAILKKCVHSNIVRLLEVLDDSKSKKVYLVLEYLEKGEIVWQNEDSSPALTREQARSASRDVILGLEYLHFQGIIHRDIKPANLLISKDGRVKISDFGVSFASSLDCANNELELAKTAGTPAFFAPELCVITKDGETRPPITSAIDVWAFGVTLFCLLYGRVPFIADTEFELFDVIANKPVEFPDELPDELLSAEAEDIAEKDDPNSITSKYNSMFYNLHEASNSSLSIAEQSTRNQILQSSGSSKSSVPTTPTLDVVSDEDLESAKDLLRKLLEKDPEKRITIPEIKCHPWICSGMTQQQFAEFLQSSSDDKLIEVTKEEVQTAVQGITGKIKRGLSRLGSSALHFAGIRRKSSNPSYASWKRNISPSSTSRSSSRETVSTQSTQGYQNRPQSSLGQAQVHCIGDPVYSSPNLHIKSSLASSSTRIPGQFGQTKLPAHISFDKIAGEPRRRSIASLSHQRGLSASPSNSERRASTISTVSTDSYAQDDNRSITSSTSNLNLKAILQDQHLGIDNDLDNESDSMLTPRGRTRPGPPISQLHNLSIYNSSSSSISSSDDGDDDGELTLVVGHRKDRARLSRVSESDIGALHGVPRQTVIDSHHMKSSILNSIPPKDLPQDLPPILSLDSTPRTRFRSHSVNIGQMQHRQGL